MTDIGKEIRVRRIRKPVPAEPIVAPQPQPEREPVPVGVS